MNRHGSSFGCNNCSKRVVISVSIHFLCCGFGRVLRSASTGDALFLECPNPLFFASHPLFWAPHRLFWGSKSPHFSTFFVFFYIAFVFFFMFIHELCAFSRFFCQIFFSHQARIGSFSGCVALICDCWVQHNSNHFPVSHWDGSMTYREISVSHWLVWITYRARPQSDTVNVYNNIYIFFYMFLWHYPYCSFLSLFIFFAYAYKARNEGSPFTSAPKVR